MIATELITDRVPSVKSTDLSGLALDWMSEFKVSQLPVVDGGKYIGLITENDILDAADSALHVGDLRYSGWETAYVFADKHVYDVLDVLSELKLDLVPVIGEEKEYLGVVTLRDLNDYIARLFAIREPGGILVIEVGARNYVLSEIGRIAESADAKVLSLYLSQMPDSPTLILTLKLNVEDLTRVIASFERFNYTVLHAYQRLNPDSDYSRNYEALLRYLNI
ncbi:MAG: CBS domain-containing protein [Bacteroidetes bacterium]|nr:MAG: CBS domain-containing protein [Bacteroidota bacterium]